MLTSTWCILGVNSIDNIESTANRHLITDFVGDVNHQYYQLTLTLYIHIPSAHNGDQPPYIYIIETSANVLFNQLSCGKSIFYKSSLHDHNFSISQKQISTIFDKIH